MTAQSTSQSLQKSPKPIVFFDGYCVLCDGFLSWLIERDKRQNLLFAPLQGETALRLGFGPKFDPGAGAQAKMLELESVVLLMGTETYQRSSAVIRSLMSVGGLWRFFGIFLLIPAPIRDWVYRVVARNRFRWFGKRETCRLPSPQERARFLP